jgi:hypothetical protein
MSQVQGPGVADGVLGGVDVVVNNTGIGAVRTIEEGAF